jgi:nicotinate-nucleotide pyrophosphorylase (carboxylating)
MKLQFAQMELQLTQAERASAESLIELALAEDLGDAGDVTSQALIDSEEQAETIVVSRESGRLAGVPIAEMVFRKLDSSVRWSTGTADGSRLETGTVVATVAGPLRSILCGERTALNFLTHLSGIATLTAQYVEAVAGTNATIFDTRKTLPGYRVLEKYAVRAGGGANHRVGLYDGCLIKDNHLAAQRNSRNAADVADAVRRARQALAPNLAVEVEVDTLEQLSAALGAAADIVLLDNMNPATLEEAVELRNSVAPGVLLEASGSVSLETVVEIARTGVERISVGALTHSAGALDLALDWKTP